MYGLKQATLAAALVEACGVRKDDKAAQRVLNWCALVWVGGAGGGHAGTAV